MKRKILIISILTLILLILLKSNNRYKLIYPKDSLAVYVNDELQNSIPKKGEALFKKAVCDNDVKIAWDNDKWGLYVSNLSGKTKCNLYFYEGQTVFNFDYTGGEQTFTVPFSGTYKLETWGAQGGYPAYVTESLNGGLGGYSSGLIELSKSAEIYINVGGKGGVGNEDGSESLYGGIGGYNGGGNGGIGNTGYSSANGGGGATHIAFKSGILSNLENFKSDILIVSGGGGGYSSSCVALGGSGGGFISNKGSNDYKSSANTNFTYTNNASQNYGYAFGKGADGYNGKGGICGCEGTAGGGGGYYGGYSYEVAKEFEANADVSGAGGSGYIGNSLLTNKVMYCYNCEESDEENTKTISTTCGEETPTENCAKKGNGYARITLISIEE